MKIADVISISKEKMLCGSVIKMMVSLRILSTHISKYFNGCITVSACLVQNFFSLGRKTRRQVYSEVIFTWSVIGVMVMLSQLS